MTDALLPPYTSRQGFGNTAYITWQLLLLDGGRTYLSSGEPV